MYSYSDFAVTLSSPSTPKTKLVMEGGFWVLFGILCCTTLMASGVSSARKAACHNPLFGHCYGITHTCPAACPILCEVDCNLCKPYCACDRPGAVCQDPRFIGGDGVMFYFHGKKDKDFCLVSDPELHINAHFIGKTGRRRRDFTWVQAIAVMFHSHHRLYIGAKRVAKWEESDDNMVIRLDEQDVTIPTGEGQAWQSPETGLKVQRRGETNKVKVQVEGLFEIALRVVPITMEESRVHGYDVPKEDCFAHLELNFKFGSLSKMVDGVLGQTYRPDYRNRVKMAAAMPLMGGADRFASSHLFATDCAVSKFQSKLETTNETESANPLRSFS